MAFLPLGQGSFVWFQPFAIHGHKFFFPMQKICGSVTKRIFVQNSKVRNPPTGRNTTTWQNSHHAQVRKPPTVRTAYHATSGSHRLAKTPPTVQMGLLTGQIFNHASHPASDSHSELESVPTKVQKSPTGGNLTAPAYPSGCHAPSKLPALPGS